MKAKEILKELGYELAIEHEQGILFDKEGARIFFDKGAAKVKLIGYFDIHVLKAIYKMFDELGWIDEEENL